MSAITADVNVRSEHFPSEEPSQGTPRGTGGRFWAGVFKWDNRLKALVGLGIGGLFVASVAFLMTWALPVVIDQVITPRFDALNQRFDGLEHRFDGLEQRFDGLEQRFDGLEQRFDAVEQQLDDVKEDLAEVREDVADLREEQAYVKGQVDLLVRFLDPNRPGTPE